LAVASVESGGMLPAAGASAAQAGRLVGHSCLLLPLAYKASRSQLARPKQKKQVKIGEQ